MEQENKIIEPTAKVAEQAIDNELEELDTQSKFHKRMFIGQLAGAAIGATLLIVSKNHKK